MIETSTLTTNTGLPHTLAVSRIKVYTRKLAEIERFIEHYGQRPTVSEPDVLVHTYWGHS